jgi:hypothetical protein
MVQKIIGDELVTDNRQTDRQQTDRQQTTDNRQTDIFELTPIHMGNFFFFFFFCIWEGENEWGEIYTSLLARQVCFAHLLRSQGEKKLNWNLIKILLSLK